MIIKVKVKPNSGKQEIIKINNDEYIVSLKSSPENNKSNIELLKLLSKKFKVSFGNIKIIKGKTSRNKIIEIT